VSYRIDWDPDVVVEVQRIYDAAQDQEAIVHAIRRASLELSQIPLESGESRGDNRRILFKYPLILWYRVNERLQVVRVTHVKLLSP